MKKRIGLILFIVTLVSLMALPVFAQDTWSNYFPIIITDTSGVDRTNVPVLTGIQGSGLVNSKYVNSDASDTRMKLHNLGTIDDADEPYLMDTSELPIVIPSLPANGSVEYDLYTGVSPIIGGGGDAPASFNIITGSGGKVTTPYNVALELGSAWQIDISGYVDTTSGVDKYILLKTGEASIKVTASQQITATVNDGVDKTVVLNGIASGNYVMSLTLVGGVLTFTVGSSSGTASVGTVTNNTNNWYWAENNVMSYINYIEMFSGSATFETYSEDTSIVPMGWEKNSGLPPNNTYADAHDGMIGAWVDSLIIGNSNASVNNFWIQRSYFEFDQSNNPIPTNSVVTSVGVLLNGLQMQFDYTAGWYLDVVSANGTDTNNGNNANYGVMKNSTTVYATVADNLFPSYPSVGSETRYLNSAGIADVQSQVTNGVGDIALGLRMSTDVSNTSPNGASTDSNEAYISVGTPSTITIGYTAFNQVLSYQPTTIVSGTSLPDLSGNGYTGTITWGTNSDISFTVGTPTTYQSTVYNNATSVSQAQSSASLAQGYKLPSIPMPANWYGGSYLTGSVTVTQGSPDVLGSGTSWNSNMVGKGFESTDGQQYTVDSVTDATHLVLTSDYNGTTLGGQSYQISNLPNLPLYGVFLGISTSSGIPINTLYFIIMVLVAFMFFFYAVMKTHSIMISGAVLVLMLAMASGTGVIAGWIVYVIGIGSIGILFLARQFG